MQHLYYYYYDNACIMILSVNQQCVCVLLDALPAAVQSPRETASAEVVHSHDRT